MLDEFNSEELNQAALAFAQYRQHCMPAASSVPYMVIAGSCTLTHMVPLPTRTILFASLLGGALAGLVEQMWVDCSNV